MSLLRDRNHAFSLPELLVVLAVVALLMIVLYGATQTVRKKSREMQEVVTLRNIGGVLHLYIADHRGDLPNNVLPAPAKALALQLGFINDVKDWSNDSAGIKNSIFRNGANETAIRRFFVSIYDDDLASDPLTAFAFNLNMGINPEHDPAEYQNGYFTKTYREIRRPSEKIYVVPAWFLLTRSVRFTDAPSFTPFRSTKNAAEKGFFPALFADGHVERVDPAPAGMTSSQINHRWVIPGSP